MATKKLPNKIIVAKKNNSGNLGPSTPTLPLKCDKCGKQFDRNSSLALHVKKYGGPDKTKCSFCSLSFTTPAGARQHERRKHEQLYEAKLASQLLAPESELFETMARIEARNISGTFFSEMATETGLTKHQIRHRREKPTYQQYLSRAKAEVAEQAENRFGLKKKSISATSPKNPATVRPIPPTPRAIRAKRRALSSHTTKETAFQPTNLFSPNHMVEEEITIPQDSTTHEPNSQPQSPQSPKQNTTVTTKTLIHYSNYSGCQC